MQQEIRMSFLIAGLFLIAFFPVLAHSQGATVAERLGYAADARLLIVHADDIGVAHSVNAASFEALETGLVNSGSIMVPCPWFPEAAVYAAAHPEADLGLHLTLTSEWKDYRWGGVLPSTLAPSLVEQRGFLHASSQAVAEQADPAEVEREIRAQVERALAFGIRPTHLDSHMGSLFATPALLQAYLKVGRAYGLPLLLPRESLAGQPAEVQALLNPEEILLDRVVIASPAVAANDWKAFYTGVIESLKPGVTELIIHVAYDDAEMQAVTVDHPDYGAAWRQRDLDFVTSDHFRALLKKHDVKIVTWRELGRLLPKG